MKENRNIDDVLFMSSSQFKVMTDAEAFVFSHVAFFACQNKYNRIFKQTTQAICNKTCYTANTVRSALESLIDKRFLKRIKNEPDPHSYHSYYDTISHKLSIGDNEFAKLFAVNLSRALTQSKTKARNATQRDISFFKVFVGKLKTKSAGDLCKGNQSKHTHKTLVLHGYLRNQFVWDIKKERNKPSRTVAFLSHTFNFSGNTVRRIINTLSQLGIVEYDYVSGVVKFNRVDDFKVTLRQTVANLTTRLTSLISRIPKHKLPVKPIHTRPPSPAEAAEHLRILQRKGRV